MKNVLVILVAALTWVVGCDRDAATDHSRPAQPDNTGVNERDRDSDAITPGAQGQSERDVELSAEIRKRVTDTELSVNAQNSKIITQDGKVTLRGPVKTQEEKDTIGRIASDVAGANNVDNQLEVESE